MHAFPRYADAVHDAMLEEALRKRLAVEFWDEMVEVWAGQGYVVEPVPAPVEEVWLNRHVEDTEVEIAGPDSSSVTDIVADVESDLATSFSVLETVEDSQLSSLEQVQVPFHDGSLSFEPFANDPENCGLLGAPVVAYILFIILMKYILLLLAAPFLVVLFSNGESDNSSERNHVILVYCLCACVVGFSVHVSTMIFGVVYLGKRKKRNTEGFFGVGKWSALVSETVDLGRA